LILPGDDTWGSPLQKKQEALFVRYEVLSPGFMAHFLKTRS